MQPRTLYAKTSDGYLAYQVIGGGPLDLMFVMNWKSNLEILWEEPSMVRFMERLGTFSRVICFDMLGAGLSDPAPSPGTPTLEQLIDYVKAVADAADCDRMAMIGDTEGGPMAMMFAATYPDRISSLVLINTFARLMRDVGYPWGLPEESVPAYMERFEAEWGTGSALEVIAPSRAGDARFREWYGRYERHSLPPGTAARNYRSWFYQDVRPVLPTIRVPTLVIHRKDNRHIRAGHGRYLAAHIPGARYVELPGDDYLFHLGASEELLDETEEFLTGERSRTNADRVLATVLFTDIVGSTERASEVGDREWRDLLDLHHRSVRRELSRFGGHEVDTAGDGFLATFDGPARAIRCACAIRQSIESVGLQVRAGLHTGEIEIREDGLSGIAIHIGARVAAVAAPNEVLVSRTVVDLVAGSGLRFEDRGVHVLKGVPDEWRLFAVA